MKKHTILTFSILLLLLTGCMDVLDKRDLTVIDDRIWDDENLATMYINKLYDDNMPGYDSDDRGMGFSGNAEFCDEMFSSNENVALLLYGLYTSDQIDAVKSSHNDIFALHKENYGDIRKINIAIDGLNNSSLPENIREQIKGQALFFRAYRYWLMIQLTGGIPMVLEPQDPFVDKLGAPRSSTSEAIQILVNDLDEAIAGLPVDWDLAEDKGRLTKGAVAAFKGRILLAWASPLFNPENKQDRWQAAYDANKEAIDWLQQMNTPRNLHPDFSTIFTSKVLENAEAVIYRRYDASINSDYSIGWESKIRPPSGLGDGGINPTWELVKAFPMVNGKFIEESGSGYDSTVFWQNRDARFYATIAYNNCDWPMAGRDQDKVWTYVMNIHENKRSPGTGFYNRKASDPTIAVENISQTSTTWHELRYAEVLMNFAEAANEIGKTDEAVSEVIKIRKRAGIEAGDGRYGIEIGISKEAMRSLIMRERQVEFAFENKRYWDIRRRKMFQNDLGNGVTKLNGTKRHGIVLKAKDKYGNNRYRVRTGEYTGWLPIDTLVLLKYIDFNNPDEFSKYFDVEYKEMEGTINGVVLSFNYLDLYNFFAVPNAFLTSDTIQLEQTIGWLGGTFDPTK